MKPQRRFVDLAIRWRDEVIQTSPEAQLARSVDSLAYACVLAAAEHGTEFTALAWAAAERSASAAERRPIPWLESLPWRLCQELIEPGGGEAFRTLTGNLAHPQSSIRRWLFNLAWVARARIPAGEAVPNLLKNIADTLGWVGESAGLAAALVDREERFWETARAFHPPAHFEAQYHERLAILENESFLALQAPFWTLEMECRKTIIEAHATLRPRVTREQARDIAERFLAEPNERFVDAAGIGDVVDRQELRERGTREPFIYGSHTEDPWIAYILPKQVLGFRSSEIIMISKATGDIVYSGSASDEG